MPPELAARARQVNGTEPKRFDVILLEGRADEIRPLLRDVAAADGPISTRRLMFSATSRRLSPSTIR